ncbi:hypothetical protein E6C27_scaffold712G00110 [Cucumis melo var. makuwa]|uniref:Uncharacterized protein n=1 Tax=Cucumis melo var. makuwa TaxID=1194695 RepID=A0A5A7SM90_CUCMM|nr:hypothetical protein E6C27_scaffold712G00110 [Cucumis melo var. makuwa]
MTVKQRSHSDWTLREYDRRRGVRQRRLGQTAKEDKRLEAASGYWLAKWKKKIGGDDGALFIETVMVGKDKKTQFDMDVLGRVDDEKNVVQPKLKLSTQEKAFMESQIRGDDNMEIEDNESMSDVNSSDTNTPTDTMNNQSLDHNDLNNLRSTSSPLLQYNENVGGLNSIV